MPKKNDATAQFTTTILRFGKMADKTGWTYLEIPADVAVKLNPDSRKSFRVKGRLDQWKFDKVALLPSGDGSYIFPLNAAARKGTGKRHGAMIEVHITADHSELQLNKVLMECLENEPKALDHFNTLTKSHQFYISKWIDSAKTDETIAKRIATALDELLKSNGFSEMMRAQKKKRII